MKSAAKNFSLLSSAELLSKALGFFTTIIIARRVGVNGLGDIGFILAVYSYFVLIANPGYDTIGARETAYAESDTSKTIDSIFLLKFYSSIAAFLLLLVFCYFTPFSSSVKQLLALQGLSLLTIPFMFQFYFRGGNEMKIVALSRIMQSGVYCVGVFLSVWGSGDLIRVPIAYGVSTVIGLYPMRKLIRTHFSIRKTIPWEQLRSLAKASFTVGAAAICIQVYLNMDTVLLGIYKTNQEVGLYTSAYKIVTLCSAIPSLIFASFLPYLISLKQGKKNEWKKYSAFMLGIGVPLGMSVGLFAPSIISILYGSEYQGAVLPLRILSLNIIAVFISMTFAQPLLLIGKEKKYLSIVAWSAGLNLILNLFFIPRYGMLGAASTTVFAEGLVAFRAWRVMKREEGLTFTNEMLEIIIVAGFALLAVSLLWFVFRWNAVFMGGIFIVLYGILICLLYTKRRKQQRINI